MDKDTAKYIVDNFSFLLSKEEKLASIHIWASFKTKDLTINSLMLKTFKRNGFLSENESVLKLTEGGYENFISITAERIINESNENIFFNNCPNCYKLARTPQARQCRFCSHKWFDYSIQENYYRQQKNKCAESFQKLINEIFISNTAENLNLRSEFPDGTTIEDIKVSKAELSVLKDSRIFPKSAIEIKLSILIDEKKIGSYSHIWDENNKFLEEYFVLD